MALTKDRVPKFKAGTATRHGRRGVAADVVIFLHALIAKDAEGYIVPASDAAALEIVGFSEQHVDNTDGLAGALTCGYVTGVVGEVDNAGGAVGLAQLGRPCFAASDAGVTTAAVSVSKLFVGTVEEYTAAKVYVFVDEAIRAPLTANATYAAVTPAIPVPAVPFVIPHTFADVATATYEYEVAETIEIIDAWGIKDGAGAANTIQVTDAADAAITNAMAYAVDKTVTHAGTIDKAKRVIPAGSSYKVVNTRAAGSSAGQLYILAIKVPTP